MIAPVLVSPKRSVLITAGLLALTLSACEIVDSKAKKPDSAAVRAAVPESARGSIATDSAAAIVTRDSSRDSLGVAATTDSSSAAADTTMLRIYPPQPRRGGVVFAFAEGQPASSPRCTWKEAPIPCYGTNDGTVVTIPLPADEDAGVFTLSVDRPGGRLVRQITVADHDFGRELIFLPESLYKRATSTREIARDARAIRGIASVESSDRKWTGRWREPVSGMRSTAYGVERYYYRATDSTRSISLDSETKTRGTFAGDTSDAPFKGPPSWRHAGIDLPAKRGTPVRAPAAGVVADVGEYILSGRTVLIDHGQGVVSAYFHLDTALVSKGDIVRVGDRIGRVGSTGLATGPHLHFGVYVHGKDVDPIAWRDMPQWLIAQGDTARRGR